MSDDIVTRLKKYFYWENGNISDGIVSSVPVHPPICVEAAREIERLRRIVRLAKSASHVCSAGPQRCWCEE